MRHDPFRPAKAPKLGGRGWNAGVRMVEMVEPAPEVDDSAIPEAQRRTLDQLTEETCKFPVGDPQLEGFFFCGAQPRAGSVYCGKHHALCYQGSPPARPFVPMRNERV